MGSSCQAPGCSRRIPGSNGSLVCRAHLHSRWCKCSQCKARTPSVKELAAVQIPPNLDGFENLPIEQVPLEMINGEACRSLWSAVLKSHWDAALNTAEHGERFRNMVASQSWMGGRDFRRTCGLLGLDYEVVLEKYNAALAERSAA